MKPGHMQLLCVHILSFPPHFTDRDTSDPGNLSSLLCSAQSDITDIIVGVIVVILTIVTSLIRARLQAMFD